MQEQFSANVCRKASITFMLSFQQHWLTPEGVANQPTVALSVVLKRFRNGGEGLVAVQCRRCKVFAGPGNVL